MGVYSYGYKAAKSPIGKKVVETVKNIFTKKGKVSPDIKSVPPFVPQTKKEKLKRDLRVATQKRKTSEVKLDNTIFRIEQQKERLLGKQYKKGKELEKKAKGGRVGLRFGTKKKSNVQKIKETFGPKQKPQSRMTRKKKKFPDLTGDGKVTFADILKGRGVINGKKKKVI